MDSITTEGLAALDLAQFNGGKNPHGDGSIRAPINADNRRAKLRACRMDGHGRVLDLLCGFGGWTIFLAELNGEVHGLDKNEGAINIARGLSDHFGQSNVHYRAADVSATDAYDSGFFDAVWIWNALIYVDRGPALDEVQRVLKPGGWLVIGAANSTGRLIEKFVEGAASDKPALRNAARQAWSCFRRGPHHEGCPNYFTRRTAAPILRRHGFALRETIVEGKMVWKAFPRNLTLFAEKI